MEVREKLRIIISPGSLVPGFGMGLLEADWRLG